MFQYKKIHLCGIFVHKDRERVYPAADTCTDTWVDSCVGEVNLLLTTDRTLMQPHHPFSGFTNPHP
jgi:hypothetical protein